MHESLSAEEELQALRLAAERHDRNGCWEATQKLLLRLPAHLALPLVRDFVSRRLPAFERHQPGVQWPREFIEAVSETGSANEGRPWPEAESDFPGPGANSFIRAVEALWEVGRFMEDKQRRSQLLAKAMERALNAERLEHWGSRHPETWALWYQLASTGLEDPRLVEIQITIMKDPEARRVEKEAWSEAAQHLEEALNVSARHPS
jgi:hypothetical protein